MQPIQPSGENGAPARKPRGAVPSPGEALLFLLLALCLFLIARRALPQVEAAGFFGSRFTAPLLAEVFALGLPLALLFARGRFDIRRTLLLGRAGLPALAGAVLMGAGTVVAASQLESWFARAFPPPPGYFESIRGFLMLGSGESLAWALVCLALAPALFEEAVFRGVLLSSFAGRLNRLSLIFLCGAAFGAYHLDIWRAPLLTLVGMVIAWTVLRAGSLWAAVCFHLTHNILAIVLMNSAASPDRRRWIEGAGDVPASWLGAAVLCLAAGTLLVARYPRRPGPR